MKWVQSYLNIENKGKWKVFFDYYLEKCGGKLVFLCKLKQKDASHLKIRDFFLKEIVEYWSNSNYSENPVFQSTYACILHNSLITMEKKPFFNKSWFKAGVENVKDHLDEASRFISFDDFVRKFKVKTSYLEYYKVVSTRTRYKKTMFARQRERPNQRCDWNCPMPHKIL